MNKIVELQQDERVYRLTDLNRLFDAVDYFKPMTVKNYAVKMEISPQAVYKQIKNERLITIEVDGVLFVLG